MATSQAAILVINMMICMAFVATVFVLWRIVTWFIWIALGVKYILGYNHRLSRRKGGIIRTTRKGIKRYRSLVAPRDIRAGILGIF